MDGLTATMLHRLLQCSCFPTLIYVNSNSNYQQTMQDHLPPSNIRIEGTLLGVLQGSSEKISSSKSSCPIDRARTGLSLDTLDILGKSSWTAAEAYLAARWWPRLSRCISATPCPSPDGSFCHSMAAAAAPPIRPQVHEYHYLWPQGMCCCPSCWQFQKTLDLHCVACSVVNPPLCSQVTVLSWQQLQHEK